MKNKIGNINKIDELNQITISNLKGFLENLDKDKIESLDRDKVIIRSIIKDKLISEDLFKIKEIISHKISFSTFYDGRNESENENYISLGYFNDEENENEFLDIYLNSNNLDIELEGDNNVFFNIYDRFMNGTIDDSLNLFYEEYYKNNFSNENIEKYYNTYEKIVNNLI